MGPFLSSGVLAISYVNHSWILGTDPNYRNDCSLANFGTFDLIFVANKGL